MKSYFGNRPFLHICECCGKREILTAKEAFDAGWDYPGEGGLLGEGSFGIVGPRTCGTCPMAKTLWWALVGEKKNVSDLSENHLETLRRIQKEPQIYDLDLIYESDL